MHFSPEFWQQQPQFIAAYRWLGEQLMRAWRPSTETSLTITNRDIADFELLDLCSSNDFILELSHYEPSRIEAEYGA